MLVSLHSGGETVGWAGVTLSSLGEHHLQLHAPPLPGSVSEARAPRTPPLECFLHCELGLGVTGSHARFVEQCAAAPRAALSHGLASHTASPLTRPHLAPPGTRTST